MSLVIIEGVDGTGKSTLKKKFVEKLGYTEAEKPHTHIKDDKRQTPEEVIKCLVRYITSETKYVMDRSPLSDIVYAMVGGWAPVVSLKDFVAFTEAFPIRLKIILCRHDHAFELQTQDGDYDNEDLECKQENLHNIIATLYDVVYKYMGCEKQNYCFEKDKAREECDQCCPDKDCKYCAIHKIREEENNGN